MTTKKILFLLRTPPYGGPGAYESIEALLVAAVFDQEVSVLFADDGVFQLVRDQDASAVGARSVGRALKALPTYDVNQVFFSARSAHERGLSSEDFEIDARPLDADDVAHLIASQDAVIIG